MTDPKQMTSNELDAAVAEAIGQAEPPNQFWSPSNNLHDAQRATIEFVGQYREYAYHEAWSNFRQGELARDLCETIVSFNQSRV